MVNIPPAWATLLQARDRADGPNWAIDPAILLEPIDGVTIRIETVVSEQAGWF